jgi:hypothetical protein
MIEINGLQAVHPGEPWWLRALPRVGAGVGDMRKVEVLDACALINKALILALR